LIRTIDVASLSRNILARICDYALDVSDKWPVVSRIHSVNLLAHHRFDNPIPRSVGCFLLFHGREIRKCSSKDADRHSRDPSVHRFAGGVFLALTSAKEIGQIELIGQRPGLQTPIILARSLVVLTILPDKTSQRARSYKSVRIERTAAPRRLVGEVEPHKGGGRRHGRHERTVIEVENLGGAQTPDLSRPA
jgi:hypothetical protein